MICISVELVGPIAVSVRGPLISYRSIGGGFDFGNRQVGREEDTPTAPSRQVGREDTPTFPQTGRHDLPAGQTSTGLRRRC